MKGTIIICLGARTPYLKIANLEQGIYNFVLKVIWIPLIFSTVKNEEKFYSLFIFYILVLGYRQCKPDEI